MAIKEHNHDLEVLTRNILHEEVPNYNLMRITALVIGVAFVCFVGWASITTVSEVTRTKGEIIPSGYAQVVQHLEGGIVSSIHVE